MLIKDIKLIFSERRMIVVLVLVIVTAVMGICFAKPQGTGQKVSFGIADMDDSEYSKLLITYFEESKSFSSFVDIVMGSPSELDDMLKNSEIDLYLIIPKDFAARLINIDNLPITAVIDSSDKTKAVLYKNLLSAYGEYISAVELNAQAVYDIMGEEGYDAGTRNKVNYSLSYDLIFTALGKDEIFSRDETERIKGIDLVNYYVYSILMLIILYTGMISGIGMISEKKSLACARLKAAGCGYTKQFISKLAAWFTVCGVLMIFILIAVNTGGRMHFDIKAIAVVIMSLMLSCAFFMLIAFLPLSQAGYITFSNMLIMMLTIIGGGIIPIMYLPEALSKIALFTPVYRFIRAML